MTIKSDEFDQKLVASLALERLLRGYNYKEANLEQLAELGGVRFIGQQFLVASTFIQREDMSWSGFGRSGNPSDWICSQLNRTGNQLGISLCGDLGDCIPCLICLSADHADLSVRDTVQLFRTATEAIYTNFGFRAQVYLSQPCQGLSQVYLAFRETYDMAMYAHSNGLSDLDVVSAGDLNWMKNLAKSRNPTALAHFYAAMMDWDFAAAQENLQLALDDFLRSSLSASRSFHFFLLGRLSLALSDMTPTISMSKRETMLSEIDKIIYTHRKHRNEYYEIPTAIDRLLDELFRYLSGQLHSEQQDSMDRIARAKVFIQDNCTDPGINLTGISQQFGFPNSTFSKQFKHVTGYKPLDFLHLTRLNLAKSMLIGTDQSIAQISQAVGYISSTSFSQAFKRYEGMTPGTYRNARKKTFHPLKRELP